MEKPKKNLHIEIEKHVIIEKREVKEQAIQNNKYRELQNIHGKKSGLKTKFILV